MIRVRPANPEDVTGIQRITAASPTAPQWTAAQFSHSVVHPQSGSIRRTVLIAEAQRPSCPPLEAGEAVPRGPSELMDTVGFAIVSALVSIYPIEAELESIAVDPACRGRGIGAALLRAAEGWISCLHSAGEAATVFRLEVRVSNLHAIRLYRSHGFAEVAIRPGYYVNPQEDAICMERNIEAV